MKKLLIAVLLLLALTWGSNASAIGTFYGVRGYFGLGFDADLITINPTTGGLDSVIGLTGMTGVGGLAVNPWTGTIYAVGGGDGTPGLHTLDPITGAATFVGGGVTASDMGFDRSGTLFGVMADDGTGTWGELAIIDTTTGGVTSIGGSFFGGIGLAFDSNDNLYIKVMDPNSSVQVLYTVDPSDGNILTTITLDRFLRNSLTIDANNTFYSTEWLNTSSQIWTINPLTGVTSALPNTVPNLMPDDIYISALDYTAPIPEPTTMLLFGSGLIGLVGFRRNFKKS